MLERKSIAVLYSGGRKKEFKNQERFLRWCDNFFELQMIAESEPILIVKEPYPEGTQHLLRIARRIKREWNKHHGFVVTLQRERFLATANLLAFMLGPVGKPVVITSAPEETLPHDIYGDIGLKANIVNATQAAVVETGGPMVVVGPQLIPPAFAHYSGIARGEQKETIDAVGNNYIGRIDFGIQLEKKAKEYNKVLKPQLQLDHAENILYLDLRNNKFDKNEKIDAVDGIVVEFAAAIDQLTVRLLPKQAPKIVVSAKEVRLIENNKAVKIDGLTSAAAAGKFIWALGQKKRKDLDKDQKKMTLKDWMTKEFIEEFI